MSGVPVAIYDVAIIRAIIALAKSLGLRLIAEGVETEEQRVFLAAHACDEAQGWLFSKARPAAEITALLAANYSGQHGATGPRVPQWNGRCAGGAYGWQCCSRTRDGGGSSLLPFAKTHVSAPELRAGPAAARRSIPALQRLLSSREREVLQLLAEGRLMKEAASVLAISPRTVEFHRYRIMAALGVKTNAELVQQAAKLGLFERRLLGEIRREVSCVDVLPGTARHARYHSPAASTYRL